MKRRAHPAAQIRRENAGGEIPVHTHEGHLSHFSTNAPALTPSPNPSFFVCLLLRNLEEPSPFASLTIIDRPKTGLEWGASVTVDLERERDSSEREQSAKGSLKSANFCDSSLCTVLFVGARLQKFADRAPEGYVILTYACNQIFPGLACKGFVDKLCGGRRLGVVVANFWRSVVIRRSVEEWDSWRFAEFARLSWSSWG